MSMPLDPPVAQGARKIVANYGGMCLACGSQFPPGELIYWAGKGHCMHESCYEATAPTPAKVNFTKNDINHESLAPDTVSHDDVPAPIQRRDSTPRRKAGGASVVTGQPGVLGTDIDELVQQAANTAMAQQERARLAQERLLLQARLDIEKRAQDVLQRQQAKTRTPKAKAKTRTVTPQTKSRIIASNVANQRYDPNDAFTLPASPPPRTKIKSKTASDFRQVQQNQALNVQASEAEHGFQDSHTTATGLGYTDAAYEALMALETALMAKQGDKETTDDEKIELERLWGKYTGAKMRAISPTANRFEARVALKQAMLIAIRAAF